MIFAVDFDGTIVENNFPEIGKPYTEFVDELKRLQGEGHKLILWTCRTQEYLTKAVEFCEQELGLHFDAINDNLPEIKREWNDDPRKVYADYYIDDKNIMRW